ncbi:ABC transporter substrate-binding protein [Auraticoccus monumenti]|uniref:Peptide/nickel transport system substrate-binding protein n=1 Tax=Auraticoccus monumenti TaxID=675864 RepID=A0A1G7EP34_9ACTN|nr:ABC transporter substrate-binding protein [Auraticoccus monumenti]SDE65428.1 peptide/nickel transport system substrate-binding protein [Auraticoccus monumenti]
MKQTVFRRGAALVASLALMSGLAACAESQREPDPATDGGEEQTFVFAASSDPVMMDPAMASDGETFRVARQIFEGLVSTVPGTTDLAPSLATEWTSSEDGLSHTFTLREGVTFHDGTAFDAEAVCANFDRWYNWTGINQSENITYYYGKLFRGFKGDDTALYKSCTADSATEATVELNSPFAAFIQAMTLPAFSMQSPTALAEHNADDTAGSEDDPRFSSYATEHPTGTGPFKFDSWERDQQVTLTRNDDYWGEKAIVSKAIVRTISDPTARTQELQQGSIDGYDLVAPADLQPLQDAGFTIQNRPAFNILYLALNQNTEAMKDVRVRQAISHAIDKEAIIAQTLPEGSKAATQFMPDLVNGYSEDVTVYEYDVQKAKDLLAEAGQEDLTIRLAYPTGVSRPYMPTPEDTFVAVQSQLEAAGITVEPVAAKWSPDYLDMVQGDGGVDKRDMHFLGWTGDYNDPDNFVGTFFGKKGNEFGFEEEELFSALKDARELPTLEEQTGAYQEINNQIAELVPGVPLAHPAPSLAFRPQVQGYTASPVQDEVWNTVSLTE